MAHGRGGADRSRAFMAFDFFLLGQKAARLGLPLGGSAITSSTPLHGIGHAAQPRIGEALAAASIRARRGAALLDGPGGGVPGGGGGGGGGGATLGSARYIGRVPNSAPPAVFCSTPPMSAARCAARPVPTAIIPGGAIGIALAAPAEDARRQQAGAESRAPSR